MFKLLFFADLFRSVLTFTADNILNCFLFYLCFCYISHPVIVIILFCKAAAVKVDTRLCIRQQIHNGNNNTGWVKTIWLIKKTANRFCEARKNNESIHIYSQRGSLVELLSLRFTDIDCIHINHAWGRHVIYYQNTGPSNFLRQCFKRPLGVNRNEIVKNARWKYVISTRGESNFKKLRLEPK